MPRRKELITEVFDLFDAEINLQPIIKWPGGKESELPYIRQFMPSKFKNFFEPFVGGGSVFMAMTAERYYINDKSQELISLYRAISAYDQEYFFTADVLSQSWKKMLGFVKKHNEYIDLYCDFRDNKKNKEELLDSIKSFLEIDRSELLACLPSSFSWHRDIFEKELYVNIGRKMQRMKKIEKEKGILPVSDLFDNVETAFMSALYMYYRALYNDKMLVKSNQKLATVLFVFLRNYAYSGMFRYNDKGGFNVPYGGIAYNHKLIDKKQNYYKSDAVQKHFATTTIHNEDFEIFFRLTKPKAGDFIFLDPPYDSEFSTYAQNAFGRDDQKRLADYLINECKAKWMMIIKNTPFIMSLYENKGLNIQAFDKKYMVSFMNRNDKNVEHLIIMNYKE